jgi:glutamyl-tRNA reductase
LDRIGVVGTSYRTVSAERLAAAALPDALGDDGLVELARQSGFSELVYIGTCNRVELHFRADKRLHTNPLLFHLRRFLAELTDGACRLPEDDALYVLFGRNAVRHLLRVTSSLDSMMVGEAQIAGQVKAAHERSHAAGLLGGILDQTFHEAFHLAKRIRSETGLSRRPVSLATLVERRLGEHLQQTSLPVLILGAGEMAREALRLVRSAAPERPVVVANRTPHRARDMVREDHHATAVGLGDTLSKPPPASAVVAVMAADKAVLTPPQVQAMCRQLPAGERLLLVDLAMPANIDRGAAAIDGVELTGIDDLREEAEANRRQRLDEIDRCEQLVEHQLLVLRRHLLDRALSPAAKSLRQSFDQVAERAVRHALSRDLSHLPDDDREALQRMTGSMVQRLVQVPLRGLKSAAWHHSSAVLDNFMKGLQGNGGDQANGGTP